MHPPAYRQTARVQLIGAAHEIRIVDLHGQMIEIAGIDIADQDQSDGLPEKAAVYHQLILSPVLRCGGAVQNHPVEGTSVDGDAAALFSPNGLQPAGKIPLLPLSSEAGHLRQYLAAVKDRCTGYTDGALRILIIFRGTQHLDRAALHHQRSSTHIDELKVKFLIKLADQSAATHAVADGQPGILVADIDQIPLPDLRIVFHIRIDGVSVQIQHLVHRHRHEDDVVLMQTGVPVEVFCFNVCNNLYHRAIRRIFQSSFQFLPCRNFHRASRCVCRHRRKRHHTSNHYHDQQQAEYPALAFDFHRFFASLFAFKSLHEIPRHKMSQPLAAFRYSDLPQCGQYLASAVSIVPHLSQQRCLSR